MAQIFYAIWPGSPIVMWLRQDVNPSGLNAERTMEPTHTTAVAGSEAIVMSRTDVMFSFTELMGKKLHLTINYSEDVSDAGTLGGN